MKLTERRLKTPLHKPSTRRKKRKTSLRAIRAPTSFRNAIQSPIAHCEAFKTSWKSSWKIPAKSAPETANSPPVALAPLAGTPTNAAERGRPALLSVGAWKTPANRSASRAFPNRPPENANSPLNALAPLAKTPANAAERGQSTLSTVGAEPNNTPTPRPGLF